MTDHPILFSAPMVRALLAGTKTQTRRVVKPQPFASNTYHRGDIQASECAMRSTGDPVCFNFGVTAVDGEGGLIETIECPYGCPGDRLWVRETWAVRGLAWGMKPSQAAKIASPDAWRYAADDTTGWQHGWKPSIHMPRAASRITLEITGVRVERLQEISGPDAIAEGVDNSLVGQAATCPSFAADPLAWPRNTWVGGYRFLWEQINGPSSWAANPWVWVVEFKRVTP